MQFVILAIGKRHDSDISKAIEDYSARLQKYCHFSWQIIPAPKADLPPDEQKKARNSWPSKTNKTR